MRKELLPCHREQVDREEGWMALFRKSLTMWPAYVCFGTEVVDIPYTFYKVYEIHALLQFLKFLKSLRFLKSNFLEFL